MRLYELLEQVSDILTPQTHSLYDYMIHTSDDNGGFLRTRYCYWEEPVPDRSVADLEKVLICFREPFAEGDSYYKDRQYGDAWQKETLVKMQLFYSSDDDMESAIEWSLLFPYPEICIVDLQSKTAGWEHRDPLC